MKAIADIIAYGDLTDVAFIKKAAGVNFSNSNYFTDHSRKPTWYDGNIAGVSGYNYVTLSVRNKADTRRDNDFASSLVFSFGTTGHAPPCTQTELYIPAAAFFSYFGGGFVLVHPALGREPPCDFCKPHASRDHLTVSKEMERVGKDGFRIYLTVSYDANYKSVTTIRLDEKQ